MSVKKENGAVDIVKLLMAVLVIIIHKPIFNSDFPNYISGKVICSVAVPFFFIASSYYFFLNVKSSDNKNRTLIDFEKRLFILYLIWTVIYIPCIFVKYNTGQYEMMSLKIVLGQILLTVKNFFLSTSFVHFWYINALMLSAAVIFLLNKKLNYKTIIALCIFITVSARLISSLNPEAFLIRRIYGMIPVVVKNALEKGLICTAGGLFLSNRNSESLFKSAAGMVLSMTALIIDGFITYKSDYFITQLMLYFFAVAFSAFTMDICLKIDMKPSKAYRIVRKYSTLMYFSHLLLMSEGFGFIADKTGIRAFAENKVLIFTVTILVSALISTLIIFLSQKERFKFLKKLY